MLVVFKSVTYEVSPHSTSQQRYADPIVRVSLYYKIWRLFWTSIFIYVFENPKSHSFHLSRL